ncbi:hypothetical protein [Streptomyces lasalocidi]|uniref:hypothetical protein n=1 Tax=Streptomyces lasalocidi TaxID=324833 RepID=UPI00143D1AC9
MQVSQRTATSRCWSSRVAAWSVVYATEAAFSPPGSQPTAAPTASTPSPATAKALAPRARPARAHVAPMHSSLPPPPPAR